MLEEKRDVLDAASTFNASLPMAKQESSDTILVKDEAAREYGNGKNGEGQEFAGLRRVSGKIPTAAWFIVLNEFCERFAYYGGSAPFQNYVQNRPQSAADLAQPDAILSSGALGKGQGTASALNNFFMFFAYLFPLLGAVVADQYLGKYRTILLFSAIYTVGWALLTVSSYPYVTDAEGTPVFGDFPFGSFIVAIVILGIGTGGIKPCVSPLCADQIPAKPFVKSERSGEQVVVDPELTTQHLYNWFYWAINAGSLAGQFVCTALERSAFWKAYLAPTIIFIVSITVFWGGNQKSKYIEPPLPKESVFKRVYHVIKFASANKKKMKETGREIQHAPGASFKFLDYAMEANDVNGSVGRNWDDKFVVQVRQTCKALTISLPMTIYWVAYNQMLTNLISQAAQMERDAWLSNDVVNSIDPIALLVFIPLVDKFLYPFLAKKRIAFGYMKRITLGIFLGALSMFYSAGVQAWIYGSAPNYDHPLVDAQGNDDASHPNAVSIYWQFIAYALIALSEIFASIGAMEYSYTHAPEEMKCFVSAVSLLPVALASVIGILISLTPWLQDPFLTWIYLGVGIAAFLSAVGFWFAFHHYDDEDEEIKRLELLDGQDGRRSPSATLAE